MDREPATQSRTYPLPRPSTSLPSVNKPGKYRSRARPDRPFVLDPEILSAEASTFEDAPAREAGQQKGSDIQELPARRERSPIYPTDEPGIDVLLVFTGLFSAVLTTFIIQSYQLLIPDVGETTNSLLAQLVVLQAQSAGIQLTPAAVEPPASLIRMRWVNGLWFAALSCSLSTALISMLAKQWLQAYTSNISGSHHHRARQRQSRYIQLQTWHVLPLINSLPLLLHVALLLFFAGLIVLLWSVDLPITITTGIIVALAYAFYCASIFLPLIYPDCPYQHPISEHLRKLLLGKPTSDSNPQGSVELSVDSEDEETVQSLAPITVAHDDHLDASALLWLFTSSVDKRVTSAALQAIAGLPRDFSATHILRGAGALHLVEQGFQSCFEKDTTVGVNWHLLDADRAWLYCKAWMNLTRGISKPWPLELLDPLWKLRDLEDNYDAAAIASSVVAVSESSLDAHLAQWDLVAYLSKYATGKVKLSRSTVCWLLDSITESFIHWEIPIAVIERAVPVLLRLLRLTEDLPTSHIRSATALALYSFTSGPVGWDVYISEDLRRMRYCEVMLMSLSKIAVTPAQFGVTDPLLDITAQELSKLASLAVDHSDQLSPVLKDLAMSSLFHLFITGRIATGALSDTALADVVHLLNHIPQIPSEHQPLMVEFLVGVLERSSHPDLMSWSVRLLKKLLTGAPISLVGIFTGRGGINAVLRTVKGGAIPHRQLQVDSWQTLCICMNASTTLGILQYEPSSSLSAAIGNQYDAIFQSEFFETFCSAITSRPWWLFEVSDIWIPTLANLCRIRPNESVWRTVIKVVRDANAKTRDHHRISETLVEMEDVLQHNQNINNSALVERTLDDSIGVITMLEQRSEVRSQLIG